MYLEGSINIAGFLIITRVCGTRGKALKVFSRTVCRRRQRQNVKLGNVSPDDILKNYGADILRIWVAASDTKI